MNSNAIVDQLHRAFRANDAAAVRSLLNQRPEFRARIDEPVGPFDSPAIVNVKSRAMLDVLLDAGADINAKSKWWAGGFGLLHSADPDLCRYAIDRGAFVDIHAASRLGMIDRVKELLTADPNLVHARGGDGQTPLHFAGTIEIAACLLDHGADIDALDVDHVSTPAQYMIAERQPIVRYLVERGCKTDLLMAAALGDESLANRLLDADPECIRISVSDEYFPLISKPNGGTIYQWALGWHMTPHLVARKFGHETTVRFLMDRSPPVVRLINACWLRDEAAVERLRNEHPIAKLQLSAADRRQAAHAARNDEAEACRLLLESGFPVDATSQNGATALHWAAFHGNGDLVRTILGFGGPVDAIDSDFGGTPLGWAIHGSIYGWNPQKGDYPATVSALISAGSKLPDKEDGSEPVREVLRRNGVADT